MKWVLIAVFWCYGGAIPIAIEFNDKESCLIAQKYLKKQDFRMEFAVCTPKGKAQ